jgi:hypothetical protein
VDGSSEFAWSERADEIVCSRSFTIAMTFFTAIDFLSQVVTDCPDQEKTVPKPFLAKLPLALTTEIATDNVRKTPSQIL